MRALVGSRRTTTANGITVGIGTEAVAALNMITTGITVGNVTSTITTDTVITSTVGKRDSEKPSHSPEAHISRSGAKFLLKTYPVISIACQKA
jgi:hypothetical protein